MCSLSSLNVTVTGPSAGGYLAIAPTGSNAGVSSLVNFDAGETVPNMAIIGVGTGGQATVSLFTPAGTGSADVIIDVFGWVSTSGFVDAGDTGARLMPVDPTRALDTRSGAGSGRLDGRTTGRDDGTGDAADPRRQRGRSARSPTSPV